MNHKVFVGIGSNINKKENIQSCIKLLRKEFQNIHISPVYETKSMGFDGNNFFNCVCSFNTTKDIYELKNSLSEIELIHGRNFNEEKFSSRTLDIDILYFDNLVLNDEKIQIPRKEILEFDFVLVPLNDINPEFIHPVLEQSHESIMKANKFDKLILKKVDFDFD